MCRRVTCKTCGKPSWAGCGAHVEQVLGDVPKADRCPGHTAAERTAAASRKSKASPADAPAGARARFSAWLKR